MLFKSISHISRHASLAKNFWTSSSNPSSQPYFFVSTSQLPRHQGQVAIRQPSGFGSGPGNSQNERNAHTSACAGLTSSSTFSTIVPLSSLDDDRQRELLLVSDASGVHHNLLLQNRVTPKGRQIRRFSVSNQPGSNNVREDNTGAESGDSNHETAERAALTIEDEVKADSEKKDQHEKNAGLEQEQEKSAKELESSAADVVEDVNPGTADANADISSATTKPASDTNVTRIQSLVYKKKHNDALDLFDEIRETQTPGIEVFNAALTSIVALCKNSQHDLSPMLDIYAQMLNDSVKPNAETYTTIIMGLLDAAHQRSQIDRSRFFQRGVLQSVDAQLEKADEASQYITLALHIFDASNAVVWQKYDQRVYTQLLTACIQHQTDKIGDVLDSYEQSGYSLTQSLLEKIIRAYGKSGDMASALEAYQKAVPSDETNAALINAYFDNLDSLEAVTFMEKILMDTELSANGFDKALSAVIIGFAQTGDTATAWNWIQKAEQDDSIPQIPSQTLVETFGHICEHGDLATADEMFDYVASMRGFDSNEIRSMYMSLCLKSGDIDKAVKECQLRGGVWDPATTVQVVEHLASKENNIGVACQVLIAQSSRLKKLLKTSEQEYVGEELLEVVTRALKPLSFGVALSLASSAFMTPRAFSKQFGIDIVQALWKAGDEYRQALTYSRLVTLDIVVLHNMWIKSASGGSLGGVSIAKPLIDDLKTNYERYVNDLIGQGTEIESSFADEVTESLRSLGLSTEKWESFLENPKSEVGSETYVTEGELNGSSNISNTKPDELNGNGGVSEKVKTQWASKLEFNADDSNKCIGYCQVKDGIYKAVSILEASLVRGELIAPEAVMAVLDIAGNNNKLPLLSKVYKLVLDHYPHPSVSAEAWDIWVGVHRRIVQHVSDKDYTMAQTAYANLKGMGSCPDATGYGQLISNAPISTTRDEASDAVALFNESRMFNVVPNTFLYNVLLSKLSKARRLREAMAFYNDMEQTKTKKSSITYGTMISACCRAGDEEFAKKLFDEMEASPNYVPRVAPFNIMLQYYIHTKRDRQAALSMYQRLRKFDIRPSTHTYKLLIDMYSTIEPIQIDQADSVLTQIVKDENPITNQHYAALIFARGVGMKDLDAAQEFYRSLTKRNRVHPDKLIFQALLESYVVNHRVEETGTVLQDMMRYNVDLNAYMANILIRGWAPVNLSKSVGLFDYILGRKIAEPSSFESIIRAFLYHGDMASAMNVLATMRSSMYPEPVISKVEHLVTGGSSASNEANDGLLLDSIFRQDAHRLVFV